MDTNTVELVVSDLDGTLLDDGKRISEENLNAVRFLAERGIAFSLCSGRPEGMTRAYIKQAAVTFPVICCNGSFIYDPVNDKVLSSTVFPEKVFWRLTEFSFASCFDYLAYTADTIYYSLNSMRINVIRAYNHYAEQTGCRPVILKPVNNIESIPADKVIKILITELHGNDQQKAAQFVSAEKDVYAEPSAAGLFDLMPCGVSKGTGVQYLAEYLGIHMQNVCVLGDNDNDVSMMQAAGMSVCIANGTESAKKAASYVTHKKNNEDGFAEGIFHFIKQ